MTEPGANFLPKRSPLRHPRAYAIRPDIGNFSWDFLCVPCVPCAVSTPNPNLLLCDLCALGGESFELFEVNGYVEDE